MLQSKGSAEVMPVYVIFLAVSFLASIAGAICGIGGGVIIKPVLDAFGVLDVSAISFLSGCTVLAMSLYSVGRNKIAGTLSVDMSTGMPLAAGAAVGGVVGKYMFQAVKQMFENHNTVGAVQAACLMILTLGTLVYTLKKSCIKTHHLKNVPACLAIGLFLGILSSFLGIGGGPINLVILFYFFSMTTKVAAQNSLYIILFSQVTSLVVSVFTGTVPPVEWGILAGMVACGVLGGITGRWFNKRLNDRMVDKLFMMLMVMIIFINVYNIFYYA